MRERNTILLYGLRINLLQRIYTFKTFARSKVKTDSYDHRKATAFWKLHQHSAIAVCTVGIDHPAIDHAFWFSILRSSSNCGVSELCLILFASASPFARVTAAFARLQLRQSSSLPPPGFSQLIARTLCILDRLGLRGNRDAITAGTLGAPMKQTAECLRPRRHLLLDQLLHLFSNSAFCSP